MTTLREKMDSLPASRRDRIKQRAEELIAEETSLRELREAHRKTQAKVAKELGIGQDSVSRLEQRSDMLISTLREYVAALGGTMKLVVEFKDRPRVEIPNLGILAAPRSKKVRKTGTRKRPTLVA